MQTTGEASLRHDSAIDSSLDVSLIPYMTHDASLPRCETNYYLSLILVPGKSRFVVISLKCFASVTENDNYKNATASSKLM